MATLPRETIRRFVSERAVLTEACKSFAEHIIDTYDGDPDDYSALFNHCFESLDKICFSAAEYAAILEGDFYKSVYEFSNSEVFEPVQDSGYTPESVERSLHAFITDYSKSHNISALSSKMAQRVGMEIDHALEHCAVENEKQDKKKKKWARVPNSPAPCKPCCMYAGRGFVYNSYKSARGTVGNHYGECKCTIIQGYAGMSVEGYDPDAYYRQWKKYEEIDARDDLTKDEKAVLKLAAADSEQRFDISQSRELATKLGEVMSLRKDAFEARGFTKESYENTVEALIKDVGNLYGMNIRGEYLYGEKLYSAIPDGFELWGAVRTRDNWRNIQFLGTDRRRRKGNPDFIADGKYIDIKTPFTIDKVPDRIHDGYVQCINRGGDSGIVIISPLRLEKRLDEIIDKCSATVAKKKRKGEPIIVFAISEDLKVTRID